MTPSLSMDGKTEGEEPFRKVQITAGSFFELAKMLEGFNCLEYDAWYDTKLGCVICELRIPKED